MGAKGTTSAPPLTADQQALVAQWQGLPSWAVDKFFSFIPPRFCEEARDVGLDYLMKASRHYDAARGVKFNTFAGVVIRRGVQQWWRRLKATGQPMREYTSDSLNPDLASPLDIAESREVEPWETHARTETIAAVRELVKTLPPAFAAALEAREFEEMSTHDAIKLLRCGLPALKSRVNGAKHMLKRALERIDADGDV